MNVLITWCYSTSWAIIHGKNRSQFGTSPSSSGLEKCQNIYRNLTPERKAKFVDASGKPGSGIYGGNTLWYGSYSECQKQPESRYCWTMFPGELSLVKNKTEVTYFLASLVLTYAIAFIVAVVVELPFASLEALAWKKWEKK